MALRAHCNFNIEPPRFTPADRFQALHEVAEAARVVARRDLLLTLDAKLAQLDAAVERLDEIESYLGIPGRGAA